MTKRARLQAPEDNLGSENRISRLPKEILVSILSRLTLKEAVRTGALSKQWQYLWTHVTVLNFGAKDSLGIATEDAALCLSERERYINWVNRVMSHHRAPTLDQLRICFTLDKTSRQAIDDWVRFAISKSTRKLELSFLKHRRHQEVVHNYDLPLNVLTDSIPRQVSAGSTGLERLQDLALKWVNVGDKALEFLLSRCLSLQSLTVWGSRDLANVTIGGSSLALKNLSLFMCEGSKSLEISNARNLESFQYFGASTNITLKLEHVPALENVFAAHISRAVGENVLQQYSSCFISQLRFLVLIIRRPKELLGGSAAFPQLPKLEKLEIQVEAWKDNSLLNIVKIVEACPNIETLELKIVWTSPSKIRKEIQRVPKCALKSLRSLVVHGYYGRTSDLELVVHFIENAPSLEEVTIDCKNPWKTEPETLKVIREEAHARRHVERHLGPKVPDGVELVIQ